METNIALTMGDFNGIGPEIILKSVGSYKSHFTMFGHSSVAHYYSDKLNLPIPSNLAIIDVNNDLFIDVQPGYISLEAGKLSIQAIKSATEACLKNKSLAMVTAPISKEAASLAGLTTPGHTEYLAQLCNTKRFGMMLLSGDLRVCLVSIHLPLLDIFTYIKTRNILNIISLFNNSLRNDFNIINPSIAVLGLNPHAGESGLLGKEEETEISPAIHQAQKNGINCNGPFAADGFFGSGMFKDFDGIVAMYHDQGLIPFKTLAFDTGVNYTMGLPIVRTSPDHGTAFSIAGQGIASNKSFKVAIDTAIKVTSNRNIGN